MVAIGLAAVTTSIMGLAPAAAQTGAGNVRFSSTYIDAGEADEFVRVAVERSGALQLRRFQIDFDTQSGTARGGSDYTDLSGTLVFEVGESVRTFVVRLQDDDVAESHEQFGIRLSNPQGDSPAVGAPATIAIRDDEVVAQDAALPDPTPGSTSPTRRVVTAAETATGPAAAERPTTAGAGRRAPSSSSVRKRQPAPVTRGQVSYRQVPSTPFELRASDSATAAGAGQSPATAVNPLLALLAGLVLARVSAELWFRSRLDRL